jgi:hypothetical protein
VGSLCPASIAGKKSKRKSSSSCAATAPAGGISDSKNMKDKSVHKVRTENDNESLMLQPPCNDLDMNIKIIIPQGGIVEKC